MAERIGVIRSGRLIAEGTLVQLREQAHGGTAATLEDVFLELVATPDAAGVAVGER
jgi:ABC-2 type transport system ATP-binding protein